MTPRPAPRARRRAAGGRCRRRRRSSCTSAPSTRDRRSTALEPTRRAERPADRARSRSSSSRAPRSLHRRRGVRRRPLRQRRRCPADHDSAAPVRARRRRPADARPERREPRPRGAHRPLRRRLVSEPAAAMTRGTALVTVSGAPRPGVREIELGHDPRRGRATMAGVGPRRRAGRPARRLLRRLGRRPSEAWDVPLDPIGLREAGRRSAAASSRSSATTACGVRATARIMDYMAGPSAAQCGPCVFGLRAIADATARLAAGRARRRRPRSDRALVQPARRSRRLPPPGRRRGTARERAARLRAGLSPHQRRRAVTTRRAAPRPREPPGPTLACTWRLVPATARAQPIAP